ncbi:RICIN domain-containing protein [Streptomyces sp. NPDC058171]
MINQNSGKALTVQYQGRDAADGDNVNQWTNVNQPNQLWTIESV